MLPALQVDDTLTFEIEANGFGCVVATRNSTDSVALSISITNSNSTSTVPEQLRGELHRRSAWRL